MNERTIRSLQNKDPQNNEENYPTWAKVTAVGAIAAGAAFGIHHLNTSDDAEKVSSYTTSTTTLELQQGDSVLNATITGARALQPELSYDDQTHLTEEAQRESAANNVVQPGYEVTVRYGEYDGEKDANDKYGTDFEVEVTPDVIK